MGRRSLQPAGGLDFLKPFTPEARFLLAALAPGNQARAADVPVGCNWHLLLSLARSHRVLPLLCASHIELPADSVADFVLESHSQIARSLLLSSVLADLLGQFHQSGIEVISLKGPVLSQMLYGGLVNRPCDDLDFLVHPRNFAAAESILLGSGFSPGGPADDYHRDYERDGVFTELHFKVTSPSAPHFDLTAAWSRARRIRFRATEARIFSPVDLVLYLALHGLKHRFSRLIWVIDLARAVQSLSRAETASLLAESRRQGLKNVVLAGCEAAHSLLGTELPQWIADALDRNQELAEDARRMASGILAGDANPTTSPEDARDYLVFADPGYRWRQRLKFFHPTSQDYRWAARHGVSRICAPLVRPIRLARKYGLASSLRSLFPRS